MKVVGAISGTSVDGIDVCVVEIHDEPLKITLQAFETIEYQPELRQRILDLCRNNKTSCIQDVCRINVEIGQAFGNAIKKVLQDNAIEDVDLIGSHGQTVWHEIESNQTHSTLQLGCQSQIAQITGVTTIANFRTADVANGGQGAPLAPIFDQLFLRPEKGFRALLNLGGIGNICIINNNKSLKPIYFDTGPANVLIDCAMKILFNKTMDENGSIAKQGKIQEKWLKEWLKHPYFKKDLPKTTGREIFGELLCEEYLKQVEKELNFKKEDFIATLTELTVDSIVMAIKEFIPTEYWTLNELELFVAGGGAHNSYLLERLSIKGKIVNLKVKSHQSLFDVDAKEAALFAVLAFFCIKGIGLGHNESILGQIQPSKNFNSLMNKIK